MKGAVRYTVVVTAIVQTTRLAGKDWATIGQEFKEGSDKPVDIKGYTPEIEKLMAENVEVYKQTVDTLDMPSLVKVINGIAP